MRKVIAGLFALMIGLSVMAPTSAQEPPSEPLPPADCNAVEPIDPAAYNEAVLASVPPLPQPLHPEGEPASEDVVAAVTDVIAQSIACTNAGDYARLMAVIDPMYAPTLIGVPYGDFADTLTTLVEASLATDVATPMLEDIDQTVVSSELLSVTNVQDHGNGVVSAVAEIWQTAGYTSTVTIYLRTQEATGAFVIFSYVFHGGTTPLIPAGF